MSNEQSNDSAHAAWAETWTDNERKINNYFHSLDIIAMYTVFTVLFNFQSSYPGPDLEWVS